MREVTQRVLIPVTRAPSAGRRGFASMVRRTHREIKQAPRTAPSRCISAAIISEIRGVLMNSLLCMGPFAGVACFFSVNTGA